MPIQKEVKVIGKVTLKPSPTAKDAKKIAKLARQLETLSKRSFSGLVVLDFYRGSLKHRVKIYQQSYYDIPEDNNKIPKPKNSKAVVEEIAVLNHVKDNE